MQPDVDAAVGAPPPSPPVEPDKLMELLGDPSFLAVNGFVAVCVLMTFVLGWVLARRARRVTRDIERSIRAVRALPIAPGLDGLDKVQACFPRDIGFTEQWTEFREGIVELPDGSCFNSLPFGQFVRDDAVLATVGVKGFKFPLIHSLPGICTGLGILGTFVGISIGLWGLDANDPSAGIQPLISGLSSAFYTSIFGVIFSMILGIWAGHSESQLLASVHDFVDAVEQKVPRLTSEKILAQLLRAERDGAESSQRASAQLSDALRHQIELQTMLMNDGKEQLELLDNIRKDGTESRANLQTIANDLADKLGNRIEQSFTSVLGPQLTRMAEAVNAQVSQVGSASTDQARRFADEMVQQLTGTLEGAFWSMGQQVEAATKTFGVLSESIASTVEGARLAVDEQRRALAESGGVVTRANEAAASAAQQVATIHQLAEQFGRLTNLVEASQTRSMGLMNQQVELQTRTAAKTDEVGAVMASASKEYAETALELGQLLPNLGRMVNDFRSSVVQLVASATAASSAIEQSSSLLRQRATDENTLLEGFRQTAVQFGGAFQKAGPALEGFTKASTELSSQRQAVTTVLSQLGVLSSHLDSTNRVLHQGLAQAEQSLGGAARGIGDVLRSTEEWSDKTAASLQHFGDAVSEVIRKSLTEYDRSLATAVTSLGASMKELDELAEEIRAGATQRRGQG